MLEKKVCLDYNENEQCQIEITDFVKREIKLIERLLGITAKYDKNLIERLLVSYKEKLNKMNIPSEKNKLIEQFVLNYSENKWLSKYSEYVPLIENAALHFLNFNKYKKQLSENNKIYALMIDVIRGEFYPFYYLAFSLLDIVSRDVTLEIAKEFIDLSYKNNKNTIEKAETVEEYAKSFYINDCPKTHNFVSMVEDGKYYLKITRCMWGDIYSDLPDLELASLLECYGDFAKMPYLNPNFVLTRTKTLVEGYPFCDFVYHDKRIVSEIKHPDDDFWKNF
ncbi:MAG TPA: L-2-amino-thiazoline-4-carboxylic acid hydrolase [Candidatus Bathyarchaeia archaeon]|nr:L-2-amino-thiazoline-4-carboxylic acid hydrolase [Candidatus Bathyarchaeia archaeon]